MTPLACTAEHDHRESATVLLRYGANINSRCNSGWTPLLRAINSNSHYLLLMLLNNGADHLISSFKDETFLHFAARRGDVETMRILGNAGLRQSDINAKTIMGHTARELLEHRQGTSPDLLIAFGALLDSLRENRLKET